MLQTKKSMIEKKGTMTWKQTESREAKRSIPPTGAKTKSNKKAAGYACVLLSGGNIIF